MAASLLFSFIAFIARPATAVLMQKVAGRVVAAHNPSTSDGHLAATYDSLSLFHQVDTAWPGMQTVSSEPFIFMIPNFVSSSECDALISKCESSAGRAISQPSSSTMLERGERTSESVYMHDDEVAGLRRRIAQLAGGVELSQLEPIKVTRYEEGQLFARHTDCIGLSGRRAYAAKKKGTVGEGTTFPNRCATVLIYLNDCESGGRTCWRWLDTDPSFYKRGVPQDDMSSSGARAPRSEICISPRKGTAVVHFPCTSTCAGLVPDLNADHEAEPIVGRKWVCQSFVWSAPMASGVVDPNVDSRLREKFEYREAQRPSAPLTEVVV